MRERKRPDFPVERAKAMYEARMSLRGIARELGYTHESVRLQLKKVGVIIRERGYSSIRGNNG